MRDLDSQYLMSLIGCVKLIGLHKDAVAGLSWFQLNVVVELDKAPWSRGKS